MILQAAWRLSDNVVQLTLTNGLTDAAVNDATVTCTVTDADGNSVTGQSWPLSLDYVAASSGIYRGTITEVAVMAHATAHIAKITATSGSLVKYWELPFVAYTDDAQGYSQADVETILKAAGLLT